MPDSPDPNLDPDFATIPLSGPRPTLSGSNVDLPLPEELAKLLPAGAYEISGFLGAGGMGAVYKGMQIRLKRPVAIKIMRRDMGKDHDFEARFEREAQAMAKLNHPNIISVIDFGEAGPDYLFIVMELVDGTDLMDVIRSKQMTQEMALTLLPQICDALQFAHDHGIVHRDIKPSNIMLTRDGRVKMADFGLAKHFDHAESGFRTQTGTGMGTPDYAAPEQFDPTTPVDHRADIYALGVMIYQMITGALPRGVWRPPSQRAPVSTQWDAVVSRAMQNDPAERYQKASEVKTELSSIPLAQGRAAGPSAAANNPQAALGGPSALPKSRAPLIIGLVVGAVVIALGAFFALRGGKSSGAAVASGTSQQPSPASTTPSATTPTPPATASTPPAAATPAPIVAPALPESGWKPLFTETEWKKTGEKGREFKDGLLHLEKSANLMQAQPSADGAIRARIHIREGTSDPSIVLRQSNAGGGYKLLVRRSTSTAVLLFISGGEKSVELGQYVLPNGLKLGDTLVLELRAQGNLLTGMINEVPAIKAQDDRIKAAANWGITAKEGWFDSVEVQSLPVGAPASTPGAQKLVWRDAFLEPPLQAVIAKLSRTPGGYELPEANHWKLPTTPMKSGALRLRLVTQAGIMTGISINNGTESCTLNLKKGMWHLFQAPYGTEGSGKLIAEMPVTEAIDLKEGKVQEVLFAFTADRLIATIDGKPIIRAKNPLAGASQLVVTGRRETTIQSAEYVSLDSLPEAEALRLLGVDEQGKDLRGKTNASSTNEKWQDVLRDPAKMGSLAGAERTPEGVRFTGSGGALLRPDPNIRRDGAVRMRATNGGTRVELRGRRTVASGRTGSYQLWLITDQAVSLACLHHDPSKNVVLRQFDLPAPIPRGAEYELELRVVGSELTVKLNGEVLGTVTDATYPEGDFSLSSRDADRGPTLIKSLEVLNLDNLAKASSSSPSSATKESPFTNTLGMNPVSNEPGELIFGGHRYRVIKQQISWSDAKTAAEKMGGHLAVITSEAEAEFVAKLCSEALPKKPGQAWLGATKTKGKSTPWTWVTGETLSYAKWPPGSLETEVAAYLTYNPGNTRDNGAWSWNRWVHSMDAMKEHIGGFVVEWENVNALSPSAATKTAPFTNTLGMKFVPVPGTPVLFSIWHTRVQDYAEFAKAQEAAGKTVSGAWKNQEKDGVPVGRELDHPVVSVNWDEAQAFCAWLTEKETAEGKLTMGAKYRLPTDADWSNAVGLPPETGATPEEKHGKNVESFPWGKTWPPPPNAGNYADETFHATFPLMRNEKDNRNENLWIKGYTDGFATTSPVGRFPANAHGLYDMGGNAWQWCEDWYNKTQTARVLRGASWKFEDRSYLLSSNRGRGGPPTVRISYNGFRCVLEPGPSARAAPTGATAPPSSAAEQWVNLLTQPARLNLPKSAVWTAEGLRITEGGSVLVQKAGGDGGLRIRTNRGGMRPFLRARVSERGYYALSIRDEKTVNLSRFDAQGRSTTLRDFTLSAPIPPEQDYTLELRVTGSTLTALLNGTTLGSVSDATHSTGGFVLGFPSAGPPIVIKSLELLALQPAVFPSPSAATKEKPFVNSLGMKFVPKSPGSQVLFSIWETRRSDYAFFAKAKKVDDSWTKMQKDGVPVSDSGSQPVVGVNWAEAMAFCAWLNEKEVAEGGLPPGIRYRLPTDAEWSSAAGLDQEDGATPAEKDGKDTKRYPWGTEWPPRTKVGNYADENFHHKFPAKGGENRWIAGYDDGFSSPGPVGSFTPNDAGIYDLGGNVCEWCLDHYQTKPTHAISRGASWTVAERDQLLTSRRRHENPDTRSVNVGFRVVLAPSGDGQAASPQSAPPAAEPWVNLLTQPERLAIQKTVVLATEGLTFTGAGSAYAKDSGPDGGIRIRAAFSAGRPELRARQTGSGNYTLSFSSPDTLSLALYNAQQQSGTPLRQFKLGAPLTIGQDYTLELRASGTLLTVVLNGTILGSVSDGTHAKGDFNLVGNTGHAIKTYEMLMPSLSVSPSPSTATKDAPFINSLGMKFVPVPGTQVFFSIWHTRVQDYAAFAKENPNPGTLWKQQKKDGVPFGHEPNHPVCGPSWDDAQAFCQWLTNKEAAAGALPKGARYRLPTDAEWSTAVGLPPEQGKTPAEKNGKNDTHFPWGTEWPPKEKVGNYADESFHTVFQPAKRERDGVMVNQEWLQGYDDGFATTSPVGSFPPNAHGLHDMGGNLWQWCEDLWTVGQQERVLRGGTWASPSRDYVLSSRRHHADPTSRGGDGFRCVLELAPSTAAVSPAPNLPVSKSSQPGAIKLWDTPAKIPKEAKVRWEDGALVLEAPQILFFKEKLSRDGIIRASFPRNAKESDRYVGVRAGRPESGKFQCYRVAPDFEKGLVVLHCEDGTETKFLKGWRLPRSVEPNGWMQVELRVVGDELTVSADGQLVGTFRDSTLTEPGGAILWGHTGDAFRDIEYVPLDTPVSTSPSPPVSASSQKFPPGQWVKLFTKLEDLPESQQKKMNAGDWNGWITPVFLAMPEELTVNYGIRARFRTPQEGEKSHYIILRRGSSDTGQISLFSEGSYLSSQITRNGNLEGVGDLRSLDRVAKHDEFTMEFSIVGSRVIARLNDAVLKTADVKVPPKGSGHISLFSAAMRDIEVINLDGLPEAEALRLLGVDEKGNDLRGKTGAGK